jgi:hypothetical protein
VMSPGCGERDAYDLHVPLPRPDPAVAAIRHSRGVSCHAALALED